mmetsp:Transcript_5247/g.9845  ORF Transcript_5247/g.9845 Transcript_5247/m.9845 type:complete len:119 (-) Transcript_5247:1498-1854(-)
MTKPSISIRKPYSAVCSTGTTKHASNCEGHNSPPSTSKASSTHQRWIKEVPSSRSLSRSTSKTGVTMEVGLTPRPHPVRKLKADILSSSAGVTLESTYIAENDRGRNPPSIDMDLKTR